jgi:two-component system cell cycle sensor histidine kinase/response regulator CckA
MKYPTATGFELELGDLTATEVTFLNGILREYQRKPDWTQFSAWWTKEVLKSGLGSDSRVYRICQDLEARLGIAQGKVALPEYRDYLSDLIQARYGSRYRFCKATDTDPGQLSRVFSGNADLSFEAIRKLGKQFGFSIALVPNESLRRNCDPDEAIRILSGLHGIESSIPQIHEQVSQERLQASKMEAIGRLAGGIAHDFNNLLTVITGYSTQLMESLAGNRHEKFIVAEIQRAAGRAAGLTRQLLAFGRKQQFHNQILDINEIVVGIKNLCRRLIGEGIDFRINLEKGIGTVKADQGQLEQVLLNLIINARDAMPKGGKLTIETASVAVGHSTTFDGSRVSPGQFVVLRVVDTGIGMSEDTKAHLFEPFFTTKEPGKGTGLGLATVYGIVKQSGGHISVDSTPHKGSTFSIYIPETSKWVAEVNNPPEMHKTSRRKKGAGTILVVEDALSVRQLVRDSLHSQGYKVLDAEDGCKALTLCSNYKRPIDLLLTDVIMPNMTGMELAEEFRRGRPDAKVLYMSGYADPERFGLDEAEFLAKPFTPDTLDRKLRMALEETSN